MKDEYYNTYSIQQYEMKDYITIGLSYKFHNYLPVKYSCQIIPLPVIQFALIHVSYTHKHVLNEISDNACSSAEHKQKSSTCMYIKMCFFLKHLVII